MSSNKGFRRVIGLLAAVPFFLLSACAPVAPVITGDTVLQIAVDNGIISQVDSIEVKDSDYSLAEVVRGKMQRDFDMKLQIHGAIWKDLYFQQDNGRLKKIYVSNYSRVKKGDVLAEIMFEPEALDAELEQLTLQINQSERQFINEDARRLNDIENMRNSITPDMDTDAMAIHLLRLEKQELEYEQFLFRQEQTRANYDKQLAELEKKRAGEQLIAPFDGVLFYVHSAKEGSIIRNWTCIISMFDDSVIQYSTQASVDILRFGDLCTVTDGKGLQFVARVASDPLVNLERTNTATFILSPVDMEGLLRYFAEAEMSLQEFFNLNLTATVLAFEAEDVLIVPKSAVRSEDAKWFAYVYEDGIVKKRYVQTGLTYMDEIQILSGLEAGQMVVLD